MDPSDAIAYYGKGAALNSLGRYTEAIESYDKALEINPELVLEINPELVNAYSNKGLTLYSLGRYAESIESFDRAIE